MRWTKADHEEYLNDLYADVYDWETCLEEFGHYCADEDDTITDAYHDRTLGTLLRRKDPIAFNVSHEERRREFES